MTQLIELTPLSDFFFGGEATFGQGGNRYYFIRSNLWPQQTSLLGMLRYELLKSEPLAFDLAQDRITNKAEAVALIGPYGFDGDTDLAFGIIDGVSPVFLLSSEEEPFFLRSYSFLKDSSTTMLEKKPGFRSLNLLNDTLAQIKLDGYQLMQDKANAYDGKTEFESMLINSDGKSIPVEDVFKPAQKTGNRKEYDGDADDSGFFKQVFYRLQDGWRFAFLASFNGDLPEGFGVERKVQLGAERRLFRLSINDATKAFSKITFESNAFAGFEALYGTELNAVQSDLQQVLLISDAACEQTVIQNADFTISESISFRHLNSNLESPNALWDQKNEPKSIRRNLLRRGSVFWTKSPQLIENELTKAGAFRRIGYNYFKTITAQQI